MRGDGGLAVVPPTWHPKYEKHYRWVDGRSPWDVPFAAMPAALIEWCWPAPPRQERISVPVKANSKYIQAAVEGELANVLAATEGTRNDVLNNAAYSLYRLEGIDIVATTEVLLSAALQVGLGEHEASRTLMSALDARRAS